MHRASAPPRLALAIALGGGVVFVASLLCFLAAYLFLYHAAPPGTAARPAVLTNAALFSVFALHHSLFARAGLKSWIRAAAPPALERSIYVWIASVLFLVVCVAWRPVPGVLWSVGGAGAVVMTIGQTAAGVFTVMAARRLDVLDLAGIRQVIGPPNATHGLDDTGPYGLVRHPIYLAWVTFVWLAPEMTGPRLVFAVVSTSYLALAIPFEERDLRRSFGAAYAAYSAKVRWRMLPFVY